MSNRCWRICGLLALAASAPWPVGRSLASDDNARHNARIRLAFGVDMPRLTSDAAVRRWVATDLSRRLGLTDADALGVDGPVRPLGDYRVVSLSQRAHGVPVVYRESRLLLDRESRPTRLLGYHSVFAEPPTSRPRLSARDAAAGAGGGFEHASSRLVFWPAADELLLSYELDGVFPDAAGATAPFERVYVDASTGEVLDRLSLTHRALDREVFDFYAVCREAGIDGVLDWPDAEVVRLVSPLVRSETTRSGGRTAERLFAILGSIHSFFGLTLDRDSFDGSGATLTAYLGIRFYPGIPWQQCIGDEYNAAWTGDNFMLLHIDAVQFPATIAHEVTHGLVNVTANLDYEYESGALDEAISDALGITFAAWLDSGAVPDADAPLSMSSGDWQMRGPQGVSRDMSDPGSVSWGPPQRRRPYPDHYEAYVDLPEDIDHGGVHINSSIINHGFYLLAQGGEHSSRRGGPEVEGIGAMRAARIFGRATEVMTRLSDFRDARYAFADVAEALHGTGSPEWVSVHTAMDAIGIPGTWDPPQPSPAPAQPAPPPQPPPPLETAPEPAPEPRTPGTPQPDPDPDPTEDDEASEPDGASGNRTIMVIALVAGLALLGAAGLMLRPRPRRPSTPPRSRRRNAVRAGRPGGQIRATAPTPVPTPKPHGDVMLGVLRPADGSRPIPLPRAQLSSREGLVIGRDLELCHVEIRHSSVSRRHVRLRVQELAGSRSILVEDLNSLEGTRIDEVDLKPFEPETIRQGQTLRIAGLSYHMQREVELRFRP